MNKKIEISPDEASEIEKSKKEVNDLIINAMNEERSALCVFISLISGLMTIIAYTTTDRIAAKKMLDKFSDKEFIDRSLDQTDALRDLFNASQD